MEGEIEQDGQVTVLTREDGRVILPEVMESDEQNSKKRKKTKEQEQEEEQLSAQQRRDDDARERYRALRYEMALNFSMRRLEEAERAAGVQPNRSRADIRELFRYLM